MTCPRRWRRAPAVVALVAMGLVAAACGPPPTAGPAGPDVEIGASDGVGRAPSEELPECPVDALDDADGPVEVTMWHTQADVPGQTLAALASAYNASQDRVKVTVQNQGTFNELFGKYTSAIPTDELPDIVEVEDTKILQLIDGGTVLPAEACMRASGMDMSAIDPGMFSYYDIGRMYWPGWVAATAPILIYVRADFEAAGLDPDDPPGTLAEIREASEALRAAGVAGKPFALDMTRWWPETWLTGAGVDIVDNDNGRDGRALRSTYDNETTREIYHWIDGMASDGLMLSVPAGSIDQVLALTQDTSMTLTSSGALTIIASFMSSDPALAAELSPGVAAFPGVEEPGRIRVNSAGYFIVNRSAPEVQAASWDFLRWLNQVEQGVRWQIEGSYLPYQQAVRDDPELQAWYAEDPVGQQMVVAAESLAAVDPASPGPLIGPYVGFTDAVEDSLSAMVFEGLDPDAAVAQADRALQAELDRYNG